MTKSLSQGHPEDERRRQEIEKGLELTTPEDGANPDMDSSYLAGLDHIKYLYRLERFEAALIDTDDLIKKYQTDPKLYEMRGTLLDRLGRRELAMRSWNQALRFSPENKRLRRFLETKNNQAKIGMP
jgi:Flp pilus assembly protein TadD